MLGDRASNVIRVGRIGEELATGAQTYFDEDVNFIGFAGRDPLTIGQLNNHPSYLTGKGGSMVRTVIRTYVLDEAFSYFMPRMAGEHTFKVGGGISFNEMPPRTTVDSGTFIFRNDAPYNPADATTYPTQFDITLGPAGSNGFDVYSRDRRYYFFVEDKWGVGNNLTLNLGVRYDHQQQTPDSSNDFGPRLGFAWDVLGNGRTVVRGGAGKFYAYVPVVLDLTHQQQATGHAVPGRDDHRSAQPVLRPDVIADSQGNHGRGRAECGRAGRAQPVARIDVQSQPASRQRRSPDGLPMVVELRCQPPVVHQRRGGCRLRRQRVARSDWRRRHQRAGQRRPARCQRVRSDRRADSARGARNVAFQRVLQTQTRDEFDGDYKSLQVSFLRRHGQSLERAAGLHDAAEPLRRASAIPTRAACGWTTTSAPTTARFTSDRRQVLAVSGTVNPWQHADHRRRC